MLVNNKIYPQLNRSYLLSIIFFRLFMKNVEINSTLLKNINRKKILALFEEQDNLSRVEIRQILKKDGKTVTNITDSLIKDGLIISKGLSSFTGGRRRELLTINPDYGYIIGIDLSINYLRGIITNFRKEILLSEKIPISPTESKSSLILKVQKTLEFLLNGRNIDNSKILGIGFVANGFYDNLTGEWLNSANNLNWKDVPIKKILIEKCNVPIYLESCTRAMTLGEKHFGHAKNKKNYIYIDLSTGIGCGIMHNNRLYKGASNMSGELGHTVVVPDGELCTCGNFGCLETVSSGWALNNKVKKEILRGVKSQIADLCDGDLEKLETDMIFKAFADGDSLAIKEIDQANDYLSIAIGNLINLLNPELIIFGGHLANLGDLYTTILKNKIKKYVFKRSFNKTVFETSSLGDDAAVLGATTLARNPFFHIGGF